MIPARIMFLIALMVASPAFAQPVSIAELPLATGPGAATPFLASAHDGSTYVSWTEPRGNDSNALLLAQFDREANTWSPAREIAAGTDWVINWADTPFIAAGLRGKVAAVWPVGAPDGGHGYHAVWSTSTDYGRTWSPPQRLTTASDSNEFVALSPLINGDWLAVWLDGRQRTDHGEGAMALYSRVLGNDDADTLVDDRVCDCCSLSPLTMPNGAVLVAYRDRSDAEVRDIAYQVFHRGKWEPTPAPVSDGWVIAGCPVNGPALSRLGAQVAVAWYTAADDQPRVRAARSRNIGRTWDAVFTLHDPERPPVGAVGSVVLRDSRQWVSWVESGGALALRGINRDNQLTTITRLSDASDAAPRTGGIPRLLLLDQQPNQPARLLLARTVPETTDQPGRVATHIVSLPTDPSAADDDDCGCGPGSDGERGHGLRGAIRRVLPDTAELLVGHGDITDVFAAAETRFKVDPRIIPLVKPGDEILAQIEQRDDGAWWLFNLRTLRRAP